MKLIYDPQTVGGLAFIDIKQNKIETYQLDSEIVKVCQHCK